jgi:ADP-ribosyl-[dinitrogen reductase] hydrolase
MSRDWTPEELAVVSTAMKAASNMGYEEFKEAIMDRDIKDKIRGALYGVAVGDALGAPLEFMSAREIWARHGYVTEMIGGGWLSVRPGEVTDDTQMTLAVAEGIVAAPGEPYAEIGRRFVDWMAGGPKDVGGTCRASIGRAAARIRAGMPNSMQTWADASREVSAQNGGRSGGNGALMRTVYPGAYYTTELVASLVSEDIARMTHWDDLSAEACVLYARMLYLLTTGGNWGDCERVLQDTRYSLESMRGATLNPTGYVVDSMMCALYSIRETESFEGAVTKAANMGGDADTIAAIAGGLAGAYYGFEVIPTRWVQSLSEADTARLDALVEAAVNNRKG